VRSVAKVSAELLAGSKVRFVGTCTAGYDHFDTEYLQQQGIAWSNAPGCNANSVVEYVFSTLSALNMDWLNCSFGVIGCGNVGGRLLKRLHQLGIACVGYDPLLSQSENQLLGTLEQALTADVVCVHTPLTRSGEFPTYHLLSAVQLRSLKTNSVLISAGRGPVVNNADLLEVMSDRPDLRVVLDVWEGEPDAYSRELLHKVQIGTPHIAGHSYDGKVLGTQIIYQRACEFLGVQPKSVNAPNNPPTLIDVESLSSRSTEQELLNQIILTAYDVRVDHQRFLNTVANIADDQLAPAFHKLRKEYPKRKEFAQYSIEEKHISNLEISGLLKRLGFNVI
jgi:erythronate-4-phosphate dehydrogenase